MCDTIYGILSGKYLNNQTFTPGSVIDARGFTGSPFTCNSGSPWSESGNSSVLNVASTILLPAGTIVTPVTWVLPSNTHVIGEGDGDPSVATPGTTIQPNGVSGAMIQFGNSTLCSPLPCSGISVEKLTLNGQGNYLDGIDNQYAGANSWVDHVTLYELLDNGLSISREASDSGPYSNIIFNTGSYGGNSSTHCAQIESVTNGSTTGSTRGIHGLTCKTLGEDTSGAVLLDSSNNSIEDVRIIGFSEGILIGSEANAQSNVLMNILGDTDQNGKVPPPVYVVDIAATHTVTDLSIMGVENTGTGSSEYTIWDQITNPALALADRSVAMYALGEQESSTLGYSRFTTSPNAATWFSGTEVLPVGTPCSANQAGSLFSNSKPSTGNPVLYVCSASGLSWKVVQ